jgi:hypothetical protein
VTGRVVGLSVDQCWAADRSSRRVGNGPPGVASYKTQ